MCIHHAVRPFSFFFTFPSLDTVRRQQGTSLASGAVCSRTSLRLDGADHLAGQLRAPRLLNILVAPCGPAPCACAVTAPLRALAARLQACPSTPPRAGSRVDTHALLKPERRRAYEALGMWAACVQLVLLLAASSAAVPSIGTKNTLNPTIEVLGDDTARSRLREHCRDLAENDDLFVTYGSCMGENLLRPRQHLDKVIKMCEWRTASIEAYKMWLCMSPLSVGACNTSLDLVELQTCTTKDDWKFFRAGPFRTYGGVDRNGFQAVSQSACMQRNCACGVRILHFFSPPHNAWYLRMSDASFCMRLLPSAFEF